MAIESVKQAPQAVPGVIRFPKQKKRGAKRHTGPCAEVVCFPQAAGERQERSSLDRLCDKLADRSLELGRQQVEREQRQFHDWLEGRRVTTAELVSTARRGIATDHFGEGPSMLRWALGTVKGSDVIRPSETAAALNLAVEQLNSLGQLIRLGALEVRDSSEEKGKFTQHALADLGAALGRLRLFGAVSRPVGRERELLCEAKAAFGASD